MTGITDFLRQGSLPAGELNTRLGLSPATLMRRVRAAGNDIVRIGSSRATRYGLRREVATLGASEVPLFRVDADGEPAPAGRLVFLAGGESAWLPAGAVFDGLPPEVADLRPSGFAGDTFAARYPELPLPPRLDDWSDEHTLAALARRGADMPGDLIVGDESLQCWYDRPPVGASRADYPALAEAAAAGSLEGPFLGGERPKFGAFVDGRHVLVKYAGRGGPAAQRWGDLLAMEALALSVLKDGGYPACSGRLGDTPSHRFLEVERFDRTGARGRLAVLSLAAVHPRAADDWAQAARHLADSNRLPAGDAASLQLFEAFGRLIANTDRHRYNAALFPAPGGTGDATTAAVRRFTLAPAFDQLPMLYAPAGDGQLPRREFVRPAPTADTWAVWDTATELAITFWERAAHDKRITDGMRAIARENRNIVGDRG